MNNENPAITPEPDPVLNPTGTDVWQHVIAAAKDPGQVLNVQLAGNPVGRSLLKHWTDDMAARREEGILRYGMPLQTGNGRDALVDAYQESLDELVYLAQCDLQGDLERAGVLLATSALSADLDSLRGQLFGNARTLSFLLCCMVHLSKEPQAEGPK